VNTQNPSTNPMSQGSAPVAIILSLALAATVGVSAQSWDAKGVAKPPPAARIEPVETRDGASLISVLVDWARGRIGTCSGSSSP
jgi:hypothetical protein